MGLMENQDGGVSMLSGNCLASMRKWVLSHTKMGGGVESRRWNLDDGCLLFDIYKRVASLKWSVESWRGSLDIGGHSFDVDEDVSVEAHQREGVYMKSRRRQTLESIGAEARGDGADQRKSERSDR
jgi:hypothetical protein